jgi:DNA-binding transcriptional MerR regulator
MSDPSTDRVDGGYRGPQVCAIVGITYRQLDYWARTDLLRPSICEARGSGTQRRYSYTDLLQLKVIKRLLDAEVSLQQARRAIEFLRSSGDDLGSANLVIEKGRTLLVHSDEEIVDLLKGGQGVFNIMSLAGVVSELQTALTEFERGTPAEPSDRAGDHGHAEVTPVASA